MLARHQELFSTFDADDPQAIETVLGRHVTHFAYFMLKSLLPDVVEAVRLWRRAGLDPAQPFVHNDLDCHLTIAASADAKRLLVAEKNVSAIEHCFPVWVFEGRETIADRSFGMGDLKVIRLWQAWDPLDEEPDWPECFSPATMQRCHWVAEELAAASNDRVNPDHPTRPSLAWFLESLDAGLPPVPWSRTLLSLDFRRSGSNDAGIGETLADELRLSSSPDWRFRTTLQQLHAAMFMLKHAAEALARGPDDGQRIAQ